MIRYKDHVDFMFVSCATYWKLLETLGDFLASLDLKCVYGIPRGGYIPAVYLSHRLGIPIGTERPFLLVDDISDTGNTFLEYDDSMKPDYTAALFCKEGTSFVPHYVAHPNYISRNTWVIFPYETRGLEREFAANEEKQILLDCFQDALNTAEYYLFSLLSKMDLDSDLDFRVLDEVLPSPVNYLLRIIEQQRDSFIKHKLGPMADLREYQKVRNVEKAK